MSATAFQRLRREQAKRAEEARRPAPQPDLEPEAKPKPRKRK